MLRPRIAAPSLALLLAACGLPGGSSGDTDSDSDAASSGATAIPTGGAVSCAVDGDCPPPGPCELAVCESDACVVSLRDPGEVVDDVPGDCRTLVCAADGSATPQSDADDVPVDGNDCTDDVCDGGTPDNPPRPVGSPCNGALVCHEDLTCQPCPVRDDCVDGGPAEPNETQSQAAALPQVRDDADAAYVCEALGSPADVDWFTFTTVDTALGAVEPVVHVIPDDPRVCMYFQCKAGGTNVVCPDGTVDDDAPLGQQGCCGHGEFSPHVDCMGFSEDATVWLRILHDVADPPGCLNYQAGYAY